jgi:uncharacterized protein (DUF4415 family)
MSDKRMTDRSAEPPAKGRTDWSRLDRLTEAEIDSAAAGDPEAVPTGVDWSKAELVMPRAKTAVSIRIDADVLDFFRSGGAGYQSRINAVLKEYVRQRRRTRTG